MHPNPRFLQIHTLTPYTSALLNRDDSGLAKRLPFGDTIRTRVSSQCLKRHWRVADDQFALQKIDGATEARRSRELVTRYVTEALSEKFDPEVVSALDIAFQEAVYGDKGAGDKRNRQVLMFGLPELTWIAREAERLAHESGDAAAEAKKLGEAWKKDFKANIKAMRDNAVLPAGLVTALFGRMVTSDPDANITAPVHVAHAFTVHQEETEGDYFVAIDDLTTGDEAGAGTIQETELTSGLFYGYVVVDLKGLLDNLAGDTDLAAKVLHNLIYLIAEVSPGAKLGSTAPYGRASYMLLEAGDRQPRSLAEAFRKPAKPFLDEALGSLTQYLQKLDQTYATGETRQVMSLADVATPGTDSSVSISELASFAASLPPKVAG